MTTPAAPQGAPTTPATPTAPSGTPVPPTTPPVPGPPPSAPASPAVPTAPAGQQPAAQATDKTFTQADLDRIIGERLDKQQGALKKQFAEALGITDPNAPVDPAAALKAAQQQASSAVKRADLADARSLAAIAGVQPAHVETFLKLVDLGPLKNVDRADQGAVTTAIQGAVDAALTNAPMFKGSALPSASGGDRQPVVNGKRTYTRAELDGMSANDLAANSDDIVAASREGRIV